MTPLDPITGAGDRPGLPEAARTGGARRAAPPVLSFAGYVRIRKYDYGRATPAAWALIARLRGEPDLSDISDWRDLRAWLERDGAGEAGLAVGRTVWRSYIAFRGQRRRREGGGVRRS